MSRFKNALCLEAIPEHWPGTGQSSRHSRCQRLDNHEGSHRSWSREGRDGDTESTNRPEVKVR